MRTVCGLDVYKDCLFMCIKDSQVIYVRSNNRTENVVFLLLKREAIRNWITFLCVICKSSLFQPVIAGLIRNLPNNAQQ